jgi:hypothetical protein
MTKAVSQQVVVIAGASSAFFENARSRLGAMPKPPPPVYPPELVAEAIVRAAAHPRREIPVGGAAAALMLAQRLAPALTDAVLAVRRVGEGSQRTPRADDGGDNLDAPLPGPGQVRGTFAGRVLRRSPYTSLVAYRRRPGELLLSAVAGLNGRRRHRRRSADAAGAPASARGNRPGKGAIGADDPISGGRRGTGPSP